MRNPSSPSRRRLLQAMGALGLLPSAASFAAPLRRAIPASGEALPLVGLGSWITFNVGNDAAARTRCAEVMRAFFAAGGRMIDSSPMYGSSQDVIGEALKRLGRPAALFAADKVWTSSDGRAQVEQSRRRWGVQRFDLLQVHNLLGWEEQLPMLLAMKRAGQLRYVGITSSEGRRHGVIERIMEQHPIDFVQISYNVLDRDVERRILPLAQQRRIGVIVNRPFRQGELTQALAKHPVPPWAAGIGCTSWAQVLLKFIISHPAITCAIPATSNPAHARENLLAASTPLPDTALRQQIAEHVRKLA